VAAGIAGAQPAPRVVGRSLGLRAVSLVAFLLFGVSAATRAAAGQTGRGLGVVAALALLSLAGAISAWGDRFTLDAAGIAYRNVFLGGLLARRLAWRDVARVHVHRRAGDGPDAPARALFLIPYAGRRMALDSVHDLEEVRRYATRACAAADAAGAAGAAGTTPVSTPPADRPR
jgi:hypothetical protein